MTTMMMTTVEARIRRTDPGDLEEAKAKPLGYS
jgi:hypothetical protein